MAEYGLTLVGAAVWSTALALLRPQPFDLAWAHALLMLAPLVLVPLGLRMIIAQTALAGPE